MGNLNPESKAKARPESQFVPQAESLAIDHALLNPAVDVLPGNKPLSVRERDVIFFAILGYKNTSIADGMGISEQTVKNHLHNIFDKVGLADRENLIRSFTKPANFREQETIIAHQIMNFETGTIKEVKAALSLTSNLVDLHVEDFLERSQTKTIPALRAFLLENGVNSVIDAHVGTKALGIEANESAGQEFQPALAPLLVEPAVKASEIVETSDCGLSVGGQTDPLVAAATVPLASAGVSDDAPELPSAPDAPSEEPPAPPEKTPEQIVQSFSQVERQVVLLVGRGIKANAVAGELERTTNKKIKPAIANSLVQRLTTQVGAKDFKGFAKWATENSALVVLASAPGPVSRAAEHTSRLVQ